ncbi:MAG: type I-U CRISPR-associated RAMP protein Csb1/Cas7u [Desulfobacteraceae bacterium]|nr:type I-U CRISPR-associated RAMP protein Csb1/Cas7u [Desulfobacteraceae bacterium]
MDNAILQKFDHYLTTDGPAALVIREHLIPVEGADGVCFPSTYANIGYNIDGEDRARNPDAKNVAIVDSVGSQANRIEPMFTEDPYKALVPQIIITAGNQSINLLNAGHRAGDAIVRYSEIGGDLRSAFRETLKGNALPLAKIAPTSLVFGVWDSRDTQAKLPRLVASTIRAFNVRKLKRSATYLAPVDYVSEGVISAEDAQKADGSSKNPLSSTGFVNALANETHGGVIAEGGIRRDAVLALSALKLLKAENKEGQNATEKLQRYILGLALVAFTKLPLGYYRQGTILVLDPHQPREFTEVTLDGKRQPCAISHEDVLTFAKAAAKEFGVSEKRNLNFNKDAAKDKIKEVKSKEAKSKKGKE